MRIFLSKGDKVLNAAVVHITGVGLIVLTLSVLVQVVTRYVLRVNISGISELPVYLLIVVVWLAGILLSRQNDHIRIEILYLIFKNGKLRKAIVTLMEAFVVISLCVFTYLSFKYVQFGIRSGEVSPGMEIPMWWVTLPVFISALFMTIYNLKTLVTSIKELIQWKS